MVQNCHDSAEQGGALETRRYRICGIVQGVGFRPFVHRLARTFAATGWVLNDSEGVLLELQATSDNIAQLIDGPHQWYCGGTARKFGSTLRRV